MALESEGSNPSTHPIKKALGEEELKKVIETIEQSLSRIFPDADMPRRKAVRELFGDED